MEEFFFFIVVKKTRNIMFNFASMELRNTLFIVMVVRHWNKLPFKSMETPERRLVGTG